MKAGREETGRPAEGFAAGRVGEWPGDPWRRLAGSRGGCQIQSGSSPSSVGFLKEGPPMLRPCPQPEKVRPPGRRACIGVGSRGTAGRPGLGTVAQLVLKGYTRSPACA
jgi:hypothetical protein